MPGFEYKKISDVSSSVTVLTNDVTIRGMLSMTFASAVYAVYAVVSLPLAMFHTMTFVSPPLCKK